MPRFVFRASMMRPVCEDAGEITGIQLWRMTYGCSFGKVVCDGKEFACSGDDLRYVTLGYISFRPVQEPGHVDAEVTLPLSLKDGDEMEIKSYDWYYFEPETEVGYQRKVFNPITTDPRLLCLAHRINGFLDRVPHPSEAEVKGLCRFIPTWGEAKDYLRTHGFVAL